MTGLEMLWLPILLSAVIVFIASFIIHMFSPLHKNDYPKLKNEDQVMDALRPLAIPPGDYMVPRAADMKDMKSPAFTEKMNKGPVLMFTMYPNGTFQMGATFVQWFIFLIVMGIFSAYIAWHALGAGANYLQVFRFIGASAFMGYAMAYWPMSIWYRRSWAITIKMTIDGLIYALLTAGTFGWLWPR